MVVWWQQAGLSCLHDSASSVLPPREVSCREIKWTLVLLVLTYRCTAWCRMDSVSFDRPYQPNLVASGLALSFSYNIVPSCHYHLNWRLFVAHISLMPLAAWLVGKEQTLASRYRLCRNSSVFHLALKSYISNNFGNLMTNSSTPIWLSYFVSWRYIPSFYL